MRGALWATTCKMQGQRELLIKTRTNLASIDLRQDKVEIIDQKEGIYALMSAMNPSPTAPSLRRLPFTVRLSPQFVNRLLSRTQRANKSHDNIDGLLFGTSDENLVLVQAFRSFIDDGGIANGKGDCTWQDEIFTKLLTTARKDPEISALELVGWYTVRANGGLLQDDIQFHDQHFKRPNDLALVLKPEGDTDILVELYCRSAHGVLSDEGHRWGAVRLARASTLVGPVEVTMRAKIQDDFFLRAYQVTSPEEEEDHGPGWKTTIQFTTRKALGLLATGGKEKTSKHPEVAQAITTPNKSTILREQPLHDGEQGNTNVKSLREIHPGAVPNIPALIPEAPRRRKVPWVSSTLVFAAAAGLTFGLVYSRGLPSGNYMPGFLNSFFPTPGLGLRLESQGDRVLLSWNRHHPVVQNAKGGVLEINDGPQHRLVSLDAAQISNGLVLYRPTSDDVTFCLEVEGIHGGKVSESMRVLETAQPKTLDLSTPAATPLVDHAIEPQVQTNSRGRDRKLAGPTSSISTQRPMATNPPSIARATTSSAAAVPALAFRQLAPVQNTHFVPPSHSPMEVPVKQKAETQGEVAFDVVPLTPAQAEKSKPATQITSSSSVGVTTHQAEMAQSTPPPEINAVSSPTREEQNLFPLPKAALPVNTSAPVVQSQKSVPGSYRAPRPLRQVLPNTTMLMEPFPGVLTMAGRVEVIVKVDETGHVTDARFASGTKKINPSLAKASILAAKQWIFTPAALNGRPVPSEHSIVFQFQTPK